MFMIMVNIRLALRSLNRNRLRTSLTMLGIVIGVAAVLTMVALGTGARGSVEGEVRSAGTNIVFVRSGNYTRGGKSVGIPSGLGAATTLTVADGEAIMASIAGISEVSPSLSVRTFLTGGDERAFARVEGIAQNFATIYSWNAQAGRMLDGRSESEAVIGSVLAEQLFGISSDAVGRSVQFRNLSFDIVGVLDGVAEDHAEVLFVPYSALQQSLGFSHVETLTVAAEQAGETSLIADQIAVLLRDRHGIPQPPQDDGQSGYLGGRNNVGSVPDDFTVETQAAQALTKGLYTPAAAFALANLPKLDEVTLDEMADTLDQASNTMTALLASIAGVSLIVGGIGIMNIMLVSITERTREIGLRMASGARSSDVAMQFLVEAVTLSLIGGIVGLLLGLLSAEIVGLTLGWPASVSYGAMLLAIGIAAIVGLVFGSYPARRASLLDPIEALRTE
jgi:putative ABC transport system permease protein